MIRVKIFLIAAAIAFAALNPLASIAAARQHSIVCDTIAIAGTIKFWLCVGPEVCNLLLIVASLFFMLDGVRRWGSNLRGAFSRTLIGLFILHTSSLSISFLPYLALFLEIWLCAKGLEARTRERLQLEETVKAVSSVPTGSGAHCRKSPEHKTSSDLPQLRDKSIQAESSIPPAIGQR